MTTQPKWPARTAARERSRAALLEAVHEVALQAGYAGTSLDAVAKTAGVTTGAIYSIFGSKRDLFLAAFGEEYREPRFADIVEPGTPMAEGLRAYGLAWAQRYSDSTAWAAYGIGLEMLLAMRAEPAVMQEILTHEDPHRRQLADDLALRARQAKEKLPLPALELSIALHACLSGLTGERVNTGKPADAVFGYVAAALWTAP